MSTDVEFYNSIRGPKLDADVGTTVECYRSSSGELVWAGKVTSVRRRGMLHVRSQTGVAYIFSSHGWPMGPLAIYPGLRLRVAVPACS